MAESTQQSLRERARNWTCNNVSIADHGGDTVTLLRKLADTIEQLGSIEIMDITYRKPADPAVLEISVTVYFYFLSGE